MVANRIAAHSTGSGDQTTNSPASLSDLASVPLSTTAKRQLAALKNGSGGAIARLLAEQLRLEEELAVLVEDLYELNDQERKLLHATRPVRDPLDVVKTGLRGPAGVLNAEAGRETSGE